MKNFLQIGAGLDVMPLMLELKQQPELWDKNPARIAFEASPHRESHDIWIRYKDETENKTTGDYKNFADEHEPIWYPAFYSLPSLRPLIFNLMRRVEGERLGGVLLYKVQPGEQIYPHTDKGWHAEYYDKFNITLQSQDGCGFYYPEDKEIMVSRMGDVFWFSNTVPHGVVNKSKEDHIILTVCIKTHRYKG